MNPFLVIGSEKHSVFPIPCSRRHVTRHAAKNGYLFPLFGCAAALALCVNTLLVSICHTDVTLRCALCELGQTEHALHFLIKLFGSEKPVTHSGEDNIYLPPQLHSGKMKVRNPTSARENLYTLLVALAFVIQNFSPCVGRKQWG